MDDPLKPFAFKSPGIWESLAGVFRGSDRPVDCVQVDVSTVCSARCLYCPRGARAAEWKSGYMNAATFAALRPLLRRSARVHLQGWGEPLLHPYFFDLAALARGEGCRVSSTSCGLHMDEETARGIVASGMDVLAFSLAGTDEESNAVRVGAPFARVCGSVALLRRMRRKMRSAYPELHCAYLLLADRISAAAALPELAAKLELSAVIVSTLDYIAAPVHKALAFAPQEADKIARAREALERAAGRARELGVNFYYGLPAPEPLPMCREHVDRTLYVDTGGALSPCIYLNVPLAGENARRRVFGNAHTEDAFACFQGERFAAFRDALRSGRPEEPCVACAKRFERTGCDRQCSNPQSAPSVRAIS